MKTNHGYAVQLMNDSSFLTSWEGPLSPACWSNEPSQAGEDPVLFASREAAQDVADVWAFAEVVELELPAQ